MNNSGIDSGEGYARARGKILLVGRDRNRTLEKRFQTAGYGVVTVTESAEAIEYARRESLDAAVVISAGCLIHDAETVFNLKDFNLSMEILVLIDSRQKSSDRFLRQMIQHPIDGTRILTRRELQKRLFPGRCRELGAF